MRRIDAHPVALAICGGPMRDTAAIPTAVKFGSPAIPHVDVGGRIGRQRVHLVGRVVSPQNAVTPAYRAVTLRNLGWRSVDLQVDGTAMTRSPYHRSPIAPFSAGTEPSLPGFSCVVALSFSSNAASSCSL